MNAQLNHTGDRAEQIIAEKDIAGSIVYGEPLFNEIMHFLTIESRCLDDERLMEWVELLAEDILYSVPVRQNKMRKDGDGFSDEGYWLYDAKPEIAFKMKRVVEGDSGWSGDPAPRSRRFISSVLIYKTTSNDEYFVQSNILVKRGRGSASRELETMSGRRDDILRRTKDGWKLARRQVLLDHGVLGMQNFAIFI